MQGLRAKAVQATGKLLAKGSEGTTQWRPKRRDFGPQICPDPQSKIHFLIFQ